MPLATSFGPVGPRGPRPAQGETGPLPNVAQRRQAALLLALRLECGAQRGQRLQVGGRLVGAFLRIDREVVELVEILCRGASERIPRDAMVGVPVVQALVVVVELPQLIRS